MNTKQTETKNKEVIKSFKWKYEFLSNFHKNPLTFDGLTYPHAEAAF